MVTMTLHNKINKIIKFELNKLIKIYIKTKYQNIDTSPFNRSI